MRPTSEKVSAIALVAAVVVALLAIAFGVGYLVGKILL
jgi:hypothetical protein